MFTFLVLLLGVSVTVLEEACACVRMSVTALLRAILYDKSSVQVAGALY
jgi:hypothetical protein